MTRRFLLSPAIGGHEGAKTTRSTRLSRRNTARLIIIAGIMIITAAVAVANRSSVNGYRGAELVDPSDPRLSLTVDGERKHRAAQITSTFENSTLGLQYDYVENIDDGRGITAGRAGFTSATGDLLLVVRGYTEVKPDNVLAPYLPALEAANGTDSVTGLGGFADAWAVAAQDADLRKLQDRVVDELYFNPAMTMAADLGIETPLGQAIIWDTMIQHGAGGNDGTWAVIKETEQDAGAVGQDESAWLDAFLDARLRHLLRMYRATTENADESSESRIDALRSLLQGGDLALDLPLTWEVYGDKFELPERNE
jgi:chitosanase